MKVSWTETAVTQARAIFDYIDQRSPAAARKMAGKLFLAGESLGNFPHKGRPGLVAGTRELVVSPTYILIYRVLDEEVEILRVWHTARERDPDEAFNS